MVDKVLFASGCQWYNRLKKIWGDIMKSSYWAGIGAIFIPVAVVWALGAPTHWNELARWLPVIIFSTLGLVYLINGWVELKNEAETRRKTAIRREKQDRLLQEQYMRNIALLNLMTKRLGAKPVFTRRQVEREIEAFRKYYDKMINDDEEKEDETW